MKIGLLTSSPDNLYLFRFLNEYNFSYHIWYDQEGGHRGDKTPAFVEARLIQGLDYLLGQGVEKCILPPVWELLFLSHEKYKDCVLPLFTTYIKTVVLPKSRIGKIGLIGDWGDLEKQDMIKGLCTTYELNENQQLTKKFNNPLLYWSKVTPLWKHFLVGLERKNWMMHNVIKHDLRYFLDAGVDTLLPLNYGYMAYDTTIQKYLSTKKCYRGGLSTVKDVFSQLTHKSHQSDYAVTISYTGTLAHLQAEKKWMWLLQKGKQVEISSIAL